MAKNRNFMVPRRKGTGSISRFIYTGEKNVEWIPNFDIKGPLILQGLRHSTAGGGIILLRDKDNHGYEMHNTEFNELLDNIESPIVIDSTFTFNRRSGYTLRYLDPKEKPVDTNKCIEHFRKDEKKKEELRRNRGW